MKEATRDAGRYLEARKRSRRRMKRVECGVGVRTVESRRL
jgi:hypothetical protein